MCVKLTNSNGIVATSVSFVYKYDIVNVSNLCVKQTEVIEDIVGLPLGTLNPLQKLAES